MFGFLKKLIISLFPIILMWFFVIAIRNNFVLDNIRVDFYTTFKRIVDTFQKFNFDSSVKRFSNTIDNIVSSYENSLVSIGNAFNHINNIGDFFGAIGSVFRELFNILVLPFNFIINSIACIFDIISSFVLLILKLFDIITNPVFIKY